MKSKLAFDRKIRELSQDLNTSEQNLARQVAHLALGQILARLGLISERQGIFKGGTTMVWRLPVDQARTTKDLDVATSLNRDEVLALLENLEGQQWGDLTFGKPKLLRDKTKINAKPYERILDMRVPVRYGNSEWVTVVLEIMPLTDIRFEAKGRELPDTLMSTFIELGLPEPISLPMLSTSRQIAEKLHGLTAVESDRGSDLFDICILAREEELDYARLANEVVEVFFERGEHEWGQGFDFSQDILVVYENAVKDLPHTLEFDQAVIEVKAIRDRINKHMNGLG